MQVNQVELNESQRASLTAKGVTSIPGVADEATPFYKNPVFVVALAVAVIIVLVYVGRG